MTTTRLVKPNMIRRMIGLGFGVILGTCSLYNSYQTDFHYIGVYQVAVLGRFYIPVSGKVK
jgi:hypothetical protein